MICGSHGGTKEPGLIHAVNDSLFHDVDPGTISWTGPPPEIVNVQSLLYASFATLFFAAFLAMLGNNGSIESPEQWRFRRRQEPR